MRIFLSVWSAVGPLIGVFLGAYLTMRIQRQHWIATSKKEEYRELISALTQSFGIILDFHAPIVAHGPEEQRVARQAEVTALTVISSRLFIAEDIKKLNVFTRWRDAVREINTGGHSPAFARDVGEILADITQSARRII